MNVQALTGSMDFMMNVNMIYNVANYFNFLITKKFV